MLQARVCRGLCPFLYPALVRPSRLVQRSAQRHSVRALTSSRLGLKDGGEPTSASSTAPTDTTTAPAAAPSTTAHVAPTESADTIERREAAKPLTFLSRPLGISTKPTSKPRSWAELKEELLDQNLRLEKRRHLVKEALRGYYHDFHMLQFHGGKMWIGPEVLIRQDKSLYFPDIKGTSLGSNESLHTTDICYDKVSVVSIITSQMAELHVASFVQETLESFEKDPDFRYVQVNLQENPLKSFVVSMFKSRLRRQIPVHLQPTYLLSGQNMEYLREPLGMTNKHVGFVYLVDEALRVRWAGCGFARPEESLSLRSCAGVLLKRLKERGPRSDEKAAGSPSIVQ